MTAITLTLSLNAGTLSTQLVIDTYANIRNLVDRELQAGTKSVHIITARFGDNMLASRLVLLARGGSTVQILADPTLTAHQYKNLEKKADTLTFTFAEQVRTTRSWDHLARQAYRSQKLADHGLTFNPPHALNVQKIMHPKITLICPKERNTFTLIIGTMNYHDAYGPEAVLVIKGERTHALYTQFSEAINNYQSLKWPVSHVHDAQSGTIDHGNNSETTYLLPHKQFYTATEDAASGTLIDLIKNAKNYIYLCPQELDDPHIIALLKQKKQEGVKVIIRLQQSRAYKPYNDAIKENGRPVGIKYVYGDLAPCVKPTTSAIRALVIDDKVAMISSAKFWYYELRDFTQQATITHDPHIIAALSEFIESDRIPASHRAQRLLSAHKPAAQPKAPAATPLTPFSAPSLHTGVAASPTGGYLASKPQRKNITRGKKTTKTRSYSPAAILLASSIITRFLAREQIIKRERIRRRLKLLSYAGMAASAAWIGHNYYRS